MPGKHGTPFRVRFWARESLRACLACARAESGFERPNCTFSAMPIVAMTAREDAIINRDDNVPATLPGRSDAHDVDIVRTIGCRAIDRLKGHARLLHF